MKTNDTLQIAFSAMTFGGVLIWRGFKRFSDAQKIQNHAKISIASAPQGHCEVEGFAWPKGKTADTTQSTVAVYRHLKLEKYIRRNKHSHWETIWETKTSAPFYIFDASGVALLDPTTAEIRVMPETIVWSKLSTQQKTEMQKEIGLEVSGFPPTEGFFGTGSNFRLLEEAIWVGCPVYVQGHFTSTDGNSKALLSPYLDQLRGQIEKLSKDKARRLFFLDKNRDGKISAEEERRGFASAVKVAVRSKNKGTDPQAAATDWQNLLAPFTPGIASKNRVYGTFTSSENTKLLLADCHEQNFLARVGSYNGLYMIGGAALICVGIFFLLAKFL